MGVVENIWIPVNFPRQMNESQDVSILSKLTAAMGYNYINKSYIEAHLNWAVTNVSIRRIKGNIIPSHFRKAVTAFKWFFSSSFLSESRKALPQCPSSCGGPEPAWSFQTLLWALSDGTLPQLLCRRWQVWCFGSWQRRQDVEARWEKTLGTFPAHHK